MTIRLQALWGFQDQFTTVGVVYDHGGHQVARFDLPRYGESTIEIPVPEGAGPDLFKMHTRGAMVLEAEGMELFLSPSPEWFEVAEVTETSDRLPPP